MAAVGVALLFLVCVCGHTATAETFSSPEEWLEWFNHSMTLESESNVNANWNYETNITDENLAVATKADARLLAFQIAAADNASAFLKQHLELKPITKRLLTKISKVGLRLDDEDAETYSRIKGRSALG